MRSTLSLLAALGMALAALLSPGVALAAASVNDNFAGATLIDPSSLPFTYSVTIDEDTLEAGEPSCYQIGKSVWYSVTPTSSGVLKADVSNSSFFDRVLYVYRQNGSGFSGLATVGCASPYFNGLSSVTFNASAGVTYYLQGGGG